MITKSNVIDLVEAKIHDESNGLISPNQVGQHIDTALLSYSSDVPRNIRRIIPGHGGNWYILPTGFVLDESSIVSIEYPLNGDPPNYLDDNDIEINPGIAVDQTILIDGTAGNSYVTLTSDYQAYANIFTAERPVIITDGTNSETLYIESVTAASYRINFTTNLVNTYSGANIFIVGAICLRSASPTTTEAFAVTFTGEHVLSETVNTLSTRGINAVVALAAHYSANTISASYGKSTRSTISADTLNNLTKVQEWNTLASSFLKEYKAIIAGNETKPFAKTITIERRLQNGRQPIFRRG